MNFYSGYTCAGCYDDSYDDDGDNAYIGGERDDSNKYDVLVVMMIVITMMTIMVIMVVREMISANMIIEILK